MTETTKLERLRYVAGEVRRLTTETMHDALDAIYGWVQGALYGRRNLQEEVEHQKKLIGRLDQQAKDLSTILDEAKKCNSQLVFRLQTVEGYNEKLSASIVELEGERIMFKNQRDISRDHAGRLESHVSELESRVLLLARDHEVSYKHCRDLEGAVSRAKHEVHSLNARVAGLTSARNRFRRERDALKATLNEGK